MSTATEVARVCSHCRSGRHRECAAVVIEAPCGCLCRIASAPAPDDLSSLTEGGAA